MQVRLVLIASDFLEYLNATDHFTLYVFDSVDLLQVFNFNKFKAKG